MLEFEPDFERRSCFVDKGQAELKNRRCLNPACTFHGRVGSGNIVRIVNFKPFRRARAGTFRLWKLWSSGLAAASLADVEEEAGAGGWNLRFELCSRMKTDEERGVAALRQNGVGAIVG